MTDTEQLPEETVVIAEAEVPFNMALSEEQEELRDWAHGFAENVVRPAGEEWDEREETPWPIIQEAAKVGLYGFEGIAQFFSDPTGLTMPIVNEELFWGDAGIGMSIFGTSLAVASIFTQGTNEQIGEWIPQCFGTVDKPEVAAFCVSEPDAGSDVSSLRTRAKFDEKTGEWVLNGQKAWATNGGIAAVHVVVASVDPELGSRGQAAFLIPPGTPGLSQGVKVKKHGIRASHTAEVLLDDVRIPAENVLGGKEKLDERLARAREGTQARSLQRLAASPRVAGTGSVPPDCCHSWGDIAAAGSNRRSGPVASAPRMKSSWLPTKSGSSLATSVSHASGTPASSSRRCSRASRSAS
jgi:acyl-CoA dehydrogenase